MQPITPGDQRANARQCPAIPRGRALSARKNGPPILESFDELPEREKQEVASAILRRTLRFDLPPLTDDDLIAQADELFHELDARETSDE